MPARSNLINRMFRRLPEEVREEAARVITIARDAYSSGGGASALVGDEERPIPSEEFIRYPEQALPGDRSAAIRNARRTV